MGKQVLTKYEVALIKHLLNNLGWRVGQVSRFVNQVQRPNITKIKNNRRWSEVSTPCFDEGMELLFRYKNQGDAQPR